MSVYGSGASQYFLSDVLTRDITFLKTEVLNHPLWQGVLDGSTTRSQLAAFALQDAWLIQEVHRLDGLAIAKAPDFASAEVLMRKLQPKSGSLDSIIAFAEAMGLSAADFETLHPLAGCAGLTTHFYYYLTRGSFVEAIACIGISETVFMEICGKVDSALRENYGLDDAAMHFFSFHEQLEQPERETEAMLRRLIQEEQRESVTQAVELSLGFEKLFYDTIWALP